MHYGIISMYIDSWCTLTHYVRIRHCMMYVDSWCTLAIGAKDPCIVCHTEYSVCNKLDFHWTDAYIWQHTVLLPHCSKICSSASVLFDVIDTVTFALHFGLLLSAMHFVDVAGSAGRSSIHRRNSIDCPVSWSVPCWCNLNEICNGSLTHTLTLTDICLKAMAKG